MVHKRYWIILTVDAYANVGCGMRVDHLFISWIFVACFIFFYSSSKRDERKLKTYWFCVVHRFVQSMHALVSGESIQFSFSSIPHSTAILFNPCFQREIEFQAFTMMKINWNMARIAIEIAKCVPFVCRRWLLFSLEWHFNAPSPSLHSIGLSPHTFRSQRKTMKMKRGEQDRK